MMWCAWCGESPCNGKCKEIEQQLKVAKEIMRKDYNLLKQLAK